MDTSYLDPVRAELRALKIVDPPEPWYMLESFAVGGLLSVGFDRESELLLVVSSQGRGVIDCASGKRVARDREEYDEDERHLEAEGIGPLQGRTIRMSGMYGGGLCNSSDDAWSVAIVTLDWPLAEILLVEPFESVYDARMGKPNACHKIAEVLALRACGFSYTGRSFIYATSSDVTIFARR